MLKQILCLPFALLLLSLNVFAANEQAIEEAFYDGDDERVIQLVSELPQGSNTVKTAQWHTLALLGKDLDDAEAIAEQAVKMFPDDYRVYLTHATVMGAQASDSIFSALGYAEKALNSLETAIQVAPEEVHPYMGLLGFHLNAPSIAGGDLDEAAILVTKIKTIDPELGGLAEVRLARAQDEPFEQKLETLLADYPHSLPILSYAANVFNREERWAEATQYYQRITELTAQNATESDNTTAARELYTSQLNAHYQLARIALLSGDDSAAAIQHGQTFIAGREDKKAIQRDLPSKSWAQLRLSELYLKADQPAQAKAVFSEIAMEDDKNFKKTYKAVKKRL